jgi:hypothetical protein
VLAAAGLVAVSLAGCLTADDIKASDIPVWSHFDACADRTVFHEWVTCAEANRQGLCNLGRGCSMGFPEIWKYAATLDQSVQRREISEADAWRKWSAYRADRDATMRQAAREAEARAAAAQ